MWQLQPPKKMIFYKKEDVARFTDTEIQKYRRKIWVIHQDYKLIDWKTVAENIIYPLQVAWEDPEKIKRKLDEILFSMDLLDKKDNMVTTLSWGEKQRVAIARALISNPEFIIADEPTWNLDTETSQKIVDILIESNQKWNTVVVITHDLALLEYMRQKHQIKVVQL